MPSSQQNNSSYAGFRGGAATRGCRHQSCSKFFKTRLLVELAVWASVCSASLRGQACTDTMGFEALLQRGGELEALDKAAAADCLGLAARVEPRNSLAWARLAELLQRSGKVHEALDTIAEGLKRLPSWDSGGTVQLITMRAQAEEALGLHEAAKDSYLHATILLPLNYMTWYNLGYHYMTQHEYKASREAFKRSVDLNPSFGRAAEAVGAVHFGDGQEELSIPWFERAVELMPKEVSTRLNLANALGKIDRAEAAVEAYNAVLALDPAHKDAACKVAYFSVQLCDWREYNGYMKRILNIIKQDKESGRTSHLIPFNGLMMPVSIADQLYLARSHAQRHKAATPLPPPYDHGRGGEWAWTNRGTGGGGGQLRVGYLSADFRNHPMGRELSVLLPAHEQQDVQVFCYAQNPPNEVHDGPYRAKFVRGVHAFREINALSDLAVAQLMREDRLDILVDLMGYTHGARDGVLAHRPVGVQISFKGYMSTMGSAYHDGN